MCESWNLRTTGCVLQGVELLGALEAIFFLKQERSVRAFHRVHTHFPLYSYFVGLVPREHHVGVSMASSGVSSKLLLVFMMQPERVLFDLRRTPVDSCAEMDAWLEAVQEFCRVSNWVRTLYIRSAALMHEITDRRR